MTDETEVCQDGDFGYRPAILKASFAAFASCCGWSVRVPWRPHRVLTIAHEGNSFELHHRRRCEWFAQRSAETVARTTCLRKPANRRRAGAASDRTGRYRGRV